MAFKRGRESVSMQGESPPPPAPADMQHMLTKAAERLLQLFSSPGEARAETEEIFTEKLLPCLNPAITTILDPSDTMALLKMLSLLRTRNTLGTLHQQLLYIRLFAITPAFGRGPASDRATELLMALTGDIAAKGWGGVMLRGLTEFLSAIVEVRFAGSGRYTVAVLEEVARAVDRPPPHVTLTSVVEATIASSVAIQCCTVLLRHIPAGPLVADLIRVLVVHARIGGADVRVAALRSMIPALTALHTLTPCDVNREVALLGLQLCAAAGMEVKAPFVVGSKPLMAEPSHQPFLTPEEERLGCELVTSLMAQAPDTPLPPDILVTIATHLPSKSSVVRDAVLTVVRTMAKLTPGHLHTRVSRALMTHICDPTIQLAILPVIRTALVSTVHTCREVTDGEPLPGRKRRHEDKFTFVFGTNIGGALRDADVESLVDHTCALVESDDIVGLAACLRLLINMQGSALPAVLERFLPLAPSVHNLQSVECVCEALIEAAGIPLEGSDVVGENPLPHEARKGALTVLLEIASRVLLNPSTGDDGLSQRIMDALVAIPATTTSHLWPSLSVLLDALPVRPQAAKPISNKLLSAPFSPNHREIVAKRVAAALSGPSRAAVLRELSTLLPALYSSHHSTVVDLDAESDDGVELTASRKKRSRVRAAIGSTFVPLAWQQAALAPLSDGTAREDDLPHLVSALAAMVRLGGYTTAQECIVLRGCLTGGACGVGLLTHPSSKVQQATRALVASVLASEVEAIEKGETVTPLSLTLPPANNSSPLHQLMANISRVLDNPDTDPILARSLLLVIASVTRGVCRLPGADAELQSCLLALLTQLRQDWPGRGLCNAVARHELQQLESRLNSSLSQLFRRFPDLFAQLFVELEQYNSSHRPSSAPLLTAVADYLDMDIESFIAENSPVMLPWALRSQQDPSKTISLIADCLREADDTKLTSILSREALSDKNKMVSEMFLVYAQPIISAVLLSTSGGSWGQYFEEVQRQLRFVHDSSRGQYPKVLQLKSPGLVRDIVDWVGRCPDFDMAIAKASQALDMLHACIVAANDYITGKSPHAIPTNPTAIPPRQRRKWAKELVGGAFFMIFDHIEKEFLSSSSPSDITLGVRTARGLVRLLGSESQRFTNKITPCLNLWLQMSAKAEGIGELVCDVFDTYLDELPDEFLLQELASFVIEVVGCSRVSEQRAARLLMKLHGKTAQGRWGDVRYLLPCSDAFAPLVNRIGTADDSSLADKLERVLVGLQSLSKECRRVNLVALLELLKDQRERVFDYYDNQLTTKQPTGTANAKVPVMARVVHRLLTMLAKDRTLDRELPSLIMSCLGAIAAVDPARIQTQYSPTANTILADIDDQQFAVTLINNFLLKTLQMPSSHPGHAPAHDKAAYAIQEIFRLLLSESRRVLGRTEGAEPLIDEVKSYEWWHTINEEGKKKLSAYLDTKYTTVVTRERNSKEVEYSRGMAFRTWLRAWMVNLIGRAKGGRGKILQVVRNVVKDNIAMALYMLPFAVLNICVHGAKADLEHIEREIDAVLSHESESPGGATEHVQVVCSLLDQLVAWRDEVQGRVEEAKTVQKLQQATGRSSRLSEHDVKRVSSLNVLIERVPLLKLAKACRRTNPARALLYMEQHLRAVRETGLRGRATQVSQVAARWADPSDIHLYQEIYSKLHEPDGLLGIAALRQQQSLTEHLAEQATDLGTLGNWTEALLRYELLMEQQPNQQQYQEKLLECMEHLGEYSVIIAYAEGRPSLRPYVTQAAWRLGDWELVEKSLEGTGDDVACFEDGVAKALMAMKRGRLSEVSGVVDKVRVGMHTELAAACLESYDTAYPHLVKLHILTDLERTKEVLCEIRERPQESDCLFDGLLSELRRRMAVTDGSPETTEMLLAVRRAIASVSDREKDVSRAWLEWGKICRRAGLYQVASGAVLRAERVAEIRNRPEGLLLEKAKLHYAQGQVHAALSVINPEQDMASLKHYDVDYKSVAANMRLRGVIWAQEINHKPAEEVVGEYSDIAKKTPNEGVFYALACFLDKLFLEYRQANPYEPWDDLQTTKQSAQNAKTEEFVVQIGQKVPMILDAYSKALVHGTKHLHHSLSRVLSLYFDLTAVMHEVEQSAKMSTAVSDRIKQLAQRTASELNSCFQGVMDQLPGGIVYTGLSQLISRITHPSPSVLKNLGTAIRKVLRLYPERAVWALVGIRLSSMRNTNRSRNLQENIIGPMQQKREEYRRTLQLLEEAIEATNVVNDLAEYTVKTGQKTMSFSSVERARALQKRLPLSIVAPSQAQLTLGVEGCFPPAATIAGFDQEVRVMSSLQKPKKITVVTSTGDMQSFLCKAKDELRKDLRIMELCHIMNLLLRKHPETRRRHLYMRTYSVTITGDESGMIEWVNGVEPFRFIVDKLYQRSPHGMTTNEIKPLQKLINAKRLSALEAYRERILPHFPPLFHKWFVQNFREPTAWFNARTAFTKTSAVWSMVGHIVGLGDRHGENILLDVLSGDAVHVDFAILFDKGMSLEVPEMVRFRLTPNMVDAMGLSGYEGVFRKCCELAMSVMRSHTNMVMGVLELFIHDPLIDWASKDHRKANRNTGPSEWRPQAEQQLGKIRRRLNGHFDDPAVMVKERRFQPTGGVQLSVQGQVQKLIANATSVQNLSSMFIWWMPWL